MESKYEVIMSTRTQFCRKLKITLNCVGSDSRYLESDPKKTDLVSDQTMS